MFKDQGMHVIHYGHEDSEVVCDEHVTVTTRQLFQEQFGDHDWKRYGLIFNNPVVSATFVRNCIDGIAKRKQANDFILCFWGGPQQQVCAAHPELIDCEPSIGYFTRFAKYQIFESYAVMHGLTGPEYVQKPLNNFYHAVIPSGLDISQFDYKKEKQDYFVMCGRLVWSKGVHIASQVCEKLGKRLVLMGTTYGPHDCNVGDRWPDHVDYIGYADIETRRHFMSNAKALFCPTLYTEPFGYVAIEAQLSGTPVICTDWGGFTETVVHGVTGYRCRTFEQFLWAADNIHNIKPETCRQWSESNYSQEKVGKMYKEHFTSILDVYSKKDGWYSLNPHRTELEWLTKHYPDI
jgi:glycosyltransferase involved in cell wall biosynthesis